ncbi:MAG: hypothetical protein RLZZ450_1263 [Pseudomonadota bacterium]|jgi:hypothetical protein
MTDDELISLERLVLSAIEGCCIPDWELEALLGCSRVEARLSVQTGLRGKSDRDGRFVDQLVVLLSALAGSAQPGSPAHPREALPREAIDATELHLLLSRLLGDPKELPRPPHRRAPELQSQIKLRVPQPLKTRAKRPA